MLEKYIEDFKDEIIHSTCEIINIPSVFENSNNPNMPFGENCNNALEYMLDLGQKLGFKTKNIDGYCGYIEFGEGKDLVGIIGHLDVVPSGDGWTYSPFNATVKDNKIYGRGAIDDKGPVIASLYAMKVIKDNLKVNKRVRLILGLNEENDWKCIEYYESHEETPTVGFSPDANFPCIYAEKHILSVLIKQKYETNNKIIITDLDYGNNALNVVPKCCSCILNLSNEIKCENFILDLKNVIRKYNYDIDIYKIDDYNIKLTSHGKQAHSAHPELGINAISNLAIILYDILYLYNIDVPLLTMFKKYIKNEFNGKSARMNFEDETGALTLNVSRLYIKDNNLCTEFNLRIPVSIKMEEIKDRFNKILSNELSIEYLRLQPGLYVPKDNYLVKTLCNVFNEMTGLNEKAVAIGGGTYARAFDNCISFGMQMPSEEDMCHKADEFVDIDNLILSTKIYAKAIYELAK